ncbi:lipopolysaccharide biosynthesis protein [Providencia rettgeri]|uniref:lipopolysaccharide biosynthesis protein n=1 Tax=Providencia rettgeri TaxID=587 RepID=UPI002362B49B|nr:lipopolysaccharide biosynthesis protein [Providencia rettgeri]
MTQEKNNKRIVKNTLFLYIRMLFMIVITLYTSRIVLETLGVIDFGIYSVVASIVTMLGFISSAMTSSTQRFLSFELGKGDINALKNTFLMSVNINVIITIALSILIFIIGTWFINNKLNIPPDRVASANWVFHCSILSFCFSVISIPYISNIIAHERLNVFAIISIIDAIMKLLILFLVASSQYDKLVFYSSLMVLISLTIALLYISYNKLTFSITRYKLYWDSVLFRKLISYTGWNFFGALAGVCSNQFSNILLNIFFGPAINASKAIASQINSAIYGFVSSIQLAMNPQIVKTYSKNEHNRTRELIFIGSKYSYYFILLISAPILFKIDYILNLWLVTIPSYTAIFGSLVIIESLISSLSNSLMSACNATGKIKFYQLIVGSIMLCNIPFSFIALHNGSSPETVYYISILLSIISLIARIIIIRKIDYFIIIGFEKLVIFKVVLVSLLSFGILYYLAVLIPDNLLGLITLYFLSTIIITIIIWFAGTEKNEREYLSILVKKKLFNII